MKQSKTERKKKRTGKKWKEESKEVKEERNRQKERKQKKRKESRKELKMACTHFAAGCWGSVSPVGVEASHPSQSIGAWPGVGGAEDPEEQSSANPMLTKWNLEERDNMINGKILYNFIYLTSLRATASIYNQNIPQFCPLCYQHLVRRVKE